MPKKFYRPEREKDQDFVRVNERIRMREIRLIYEGQNMGVVPTIDALDKARSLGLDLVEVSAQSRPPVCEIMDYGKFKFERGKKKKQAVTASQKEKEVAFRYVIGDHDLETKAGQVRKFLIKGYRVKLVVKFKAREKAHKDKGFDALNKLIKHVSDISVVEKAPYFEGQNLIARLDVKKVKEDE